MPPSVKKNLVLVRAGMKSLHAFWLQDGDPEFDLIVIAYESLSDELIHGSLRSLLIPGPKVYGINQFFQQHWDLVSSYERIAIVDDDIMTSASALNRAFTMGAAYKLRIWQPALSSDSYFSHGITVSNPLFQLRFTNFVEMMCPFFSYQHLADCRFLFDLGLESGIDQMWCRVGGLKDLGSGVLDCVVVEHTRKVGKLRADQGFVGEYSDYLTYIEAAKKSLNYTFSGAVSYAAILRNGSKIRNRLLMSLMCVFPMLDYAKAKDKEWFIRPLLNHCGRNLLTRIDHTNIADDMVLLPNGSWRA